MDLSQISKGKLSLNPVRFCIRKMVNEISKLINFQAKEKGLVFTVDFQFSRDRNIMFYSDPTRIKQVILNLLGNALKFTQSGFIKLTIKENGRWITENLNPEEGPLMINDSHEVSTLKISVSDSGCGIKRTDIPKIFQLFGMLRNKENKNENLTGVGLGLAVSQKLVRILNKNRIGAQIDVESDYGKGSTFNFLLNRLELSEELNISKKELKSNSNEGSNNIFNERENIGMIPQINIQSHEKILNKIDSFKKILLVEDDQLNILVLKKIFENFKDCQITFAFNGKEAIDTLKENAKNKIFFNIIFMDCNMPVMDGFEATKGILQMIDNKEIPYVPIIASTANVNQSNRESCFKCGMVDFISKPFTKIILREKIDLFVK